MSEFNDEFENEEDRKEFENTFKKYKEIKKNMQETTDYFNKLTNEINTKGFAIMEGKYRYLPNCNTMLSKLSKFGNTALYINYLN